MLSTNPSWATLDPKALGKDSEPHYVRNIVGGVWQEESSIKGKLSIPHPMDKDAFPICNVADTSVDELGPFRESMMSVKKSGVHNPIKNVERYLLYGDISRKVRLFFFCFTSLSIALVFGYAYIYIYIDVHILLELSMIHTHADFDLHSNLGGCCSLRTRESGIFHTSYHELCAKEPCSSSRR
jgi:hypothetical protein